MSTQTSSDEYSISVFMGELTSAQITLYAADGFTDEMVAGIYAALAGATWPAAVTPGANIAVFKNGQATTGYETDYSAAPVTFS